MVPKHVADQLAPHIAAANSNGNQDPQALAEHFAANADQYAEKDKNTPKNRFKGFFSRWTGSQDNGDYSTVHARNEDEYDTEMVDLLDVIGMLSLLLLPQGH